MTKQNNDELDAIVKLVFERGVGAYNMDDRRYLAQKDATRAEAVEKLDALINKRVVEAKLEELYKIDDKFGDKYHDLYLFLGSRVTKLTKANNKAKSN